MSETNDTPARPEGETGAWPADCVQRAFVDGAAWWEFISTKGTMWRSDRDKAEVEAVRRYGEPVTPTPPARERGEATPAPASGEEGKVCDLCDTPFTPKDWPNGYRTWYCATCSSPGELRPRLRAAKAEVARLTRELAEAREAAGEDVDTARLALDAASAKNARLREAVQALTQDDVDFLLDMVDHDPDPRTAPVEANEALESLASRIDAARRALGQEGA